MPLWYEKSHISLLAPDETKVKAVMNWQKMLTVIVESVLNATNQNLQLLLEY